MGREVVARVRAGVLATAALLVVVWASRREPPPETESCPPTDRFRPVLQNGVSRPSQLPLAQAVVDAVDANEPARCDSLPEVAVERITLGFTSTPSTREWQTFCRSLFAGEPSACSDVSSSVEPDLKHECETYYETRDTFRTASPQHCVDDALTTFHGSPDEVRNCFGTFFGKKAFTQRQTDLLACLRLPMRANDVYGPDQEACLANLARRTRDPLPCRLIRNPWDNDKNPDSQPRCLRSIGAI